MLQRARHALMRHVPAGFYRNLSWQYLSSFTAVAAGFVYSVLVARALGPRDFGLISLALSFAAVVFQAVELRLQEAVIRYVAEFWEVRDGRRTIAALKLFLVADVSTGVLAFVLLLGASGWAVTHLLHDSRGHTVILLAATTVFLSNVATATAYGVFRVFGDFRSQALITSAGHLIKLLLTTIVLFALQWGVVAVLVVGVAASLVTNVLLVGCAVRLLGKRIPLRQTVAPMSLLSGRGTEIRRFVTSTYLLSLTMVPTKDLDVNVLGFFVSLQVIGVYKVAKSFMVAVWTIADPMFLVIYPELARMWTRRAFAEMHGFLRRITLIVGISAFCAYLAACVVVPVVIVAFIGPAYAEAGPLFRWMTWGLVLWAPLVWVNPLLLAAGRPELVLKASVTAGAITLVLYAAVIPWAGGTGAAFVYALANPLVLTVAVALGRHNDIIPRLFESPTSASKSTL